MGCESHVPRSTARLPPQAPAPLHARLPSRVSTPVPPTPEPSKGSSAAVSPAESLDQRRAGARGAVREALRRHKKGVSSLREKTFSFSEGKEKMRNHVE